MVDHHDNGGSAPAHKRTEIVSLETSIVTVCVEGRDRKPPPKTKHRARLLDTIVSVLLRQDWLPTVHAVQLPGGFFRIASPIGLQSSECRRESLANSKASIACAAASLRLSERWPGIALIVGIDSDPLSKKLGGDQLNVAWQGGVIVALGRKAFPVDQDTNGEGPVYWVNPADSDDQGRILDLSNGARALLLSCYDAFAVRALGGDRYADLNAIQMIVGDNGKIIQAPPASRRQLLERWLAFLRIEQPDLGLIAIHRFRRPGQDGYWQRHGIAAAAAALQRLIIGAAHIREGLPAPQAMTLAAADVPPEHLELGPFRPALRLQPDHGIELRSDAGGAIIRLFNLKLERNIS